MIKFNVVAQIGLIAFLLLFNIHFNDARSTAPVPTSLIFSSKLSIDARWLINAFTTSAARDLYFGVSVEGFIARMDPNGTIIAKIPHGSHWGLAVSAEGNLWTTYRDLGKEAVGLLNQDGKVLRTFSREVTTLKTPVHIVVDSPDTLLVADSEGGQVVRINSTTGAAVQTFKHSSGWGPTAATYGVNNTVWVLDSWLQRIYLLGSTGSVLAVTTTTNPTSIPYDMSVDNYGNLFLTDSKNARLLVLSSNGTVVLTVKSEHLRSPRQIVVTTNGDVAVLDVYANTVLFFTPTYSKDTSEVQEQ